MNKRALGWILISVVVILPACAPRPASDIEFKVRLDPSAAKAPVTGRLKVCLNSNLLEDPGEHLEQALWDPEPFYYLDVANWRPGETIKVDGKSGHFFCRLEDLPRKRYAFQAIFVPADPARDHTEKAGFLWGPVVIEKLEPGRASSISLVLENVLPARPFPESENVRELVVHSPLLSRFYGRPVDMRAAVILPESYGLEPGRRYPTVYAIHGMFGSYRSVTAGQRRYGGSGAGSDKILVLLDGNGPLGHHTFCDSENNGPRASALVEELAPALEKLYRAIPEARARFLTGQSSGAWASLWLQVSYPEFFGGAWAASPDPLDFSRFSYAGDIYAPGANIYYGKDGRELPFWIAGGYPICTFKESYALEDAMGTASQVTSWEAAWGRRGKDGRPEPFFDRTTGALDPGTLASWKRYDIALILKERWPELGPHLRGKIHVYAGDHDDFALDKAVLSLKNVLGTLGAEATVDILPGGHSLWSPEFTARIQKEMDAALGIGPK